MKIAILIPSRERINRRLTIISSIITTVSDINNVNIYFGVDEDDPTRDILYKISKAIPCVKIVDIKNDKQFIGLGKMWNICVENSDEKIISMIGDDMVFRTPNWDVEVIKEFTEKLPEDKIKAIYCNDDCHGERLAVNFFCHRKYVEVLGKFMREEFKINWIDTWLQQVMSAFGRLSYRGDIMIEHKHWVLGKDSKDKTAERMDIADTGKISDKLWNELVDERVKDVLKLGEYLQQTPDWSVVDTRGTTIKLS